MACGVVIDPSQEPAPDSRVAIYHELWSELHNYYKSWVDENHAIKFMNEFNLRVPGNSCKCRSKWIGYFLRNPPDYSSPEAFFEWTVRAHNWVNETLGKPQMDFEDAKKLYS